MEKIYRLLQRYPSLPSDWEVGMEVGLGDRNYGYSPCAGNYSDYKRLHNSEVENNADFWEKVIVKQYEIINFHKGDNKIISLKRLIDGQVFTLGNKVQFDNEPTINGFIKKFNLVGEMIFVEYGNKISYLNRVNIIKIPLFTTEDGVGIFEGGTVFQVRKDNYCLQHMSLGNNKTSSEFNANKINRTLNLIFSTKENAEKYITENKPHYSLIDMVKMANHWAFIKGQPNISNCSKIIEKWNI